MSSRTAASTYASPTCGRRAIASICLPRACASPPAHPDRSRPSSSCTPRVLPALVARKVLSGCVDFVQSARAGKGLRMGCVGRLRTISSSRRPGKSMFTVRDCRALRQRTNDVKVARGGTDRRKLNLLPQDYPMAWPYAPVPPRLAQRTSAWAVVSAPLAPTLGRLARAHLWTARAHDPDIGITWDGSRGRALIETKQTYITRTECYSV